MPRRKSSSSFSKAQVRTHPRANAAPAGKSRRNSFVETAVNKALEYIDTALTGTTFSLPSPANRRLCDEKLKLSASHRVACLFLALYSLTDTEWDFDQVPTGARGKFGDKRLAEQLSQRSLTLHDAITAFGENLGWKGDVKAISLQRRDKFSAFVKALEDATPAERERIARYLAARFAESRREMTPLPPVGSDVLTFVRAKDLFLRLLAEKSEGHIQQFLAAALLAVHRRRFGYNTVTHHPHAADKYDRTAGDIEEWHGDTLVRAYEVTVRPDWKSRMSVFKSKMDAFRLTKYVILASAVNTDEELAEPARLLTFLKPYGRDIAVVDLKDFFAVMAMELWPDELRAAVNLCYDHLCNPKLCGVPSYQEAYRAIVNRWLDSAPTDSGTKT